MGRRRGAWFRDNDLAALPAQEFYPRWGRGETREDREWGAVFEALQVIAKHAVEARDAKMAGRCLAAVALIGQGYQWMWQDVNYLFPMPTIEESGDLHADARARGAAVHDLARSFYVSGVYRRPHALLRAEARGLVWTLRWLARMGLLDHTLLHEKATEVFTRSPEGQRRQRFYEKV